MTLTLLQAADRASFAGAVIPFDSTLVFPGAVPITFDSPYLRLTLATDQLTLSQSSDVELSAELTPAATSAIVHQLNTLLTACGRAADAADASSGARCPVPSPQFVPGSMSGTLMSQPSDLTLGVASSSTGLITITGEADFDGSYRMLDFNDVAHARTGSFRSRSTQRPTR